MKTNLMRKKGKITIVVLFALLLAVTVSLSVQANTYESVTTYQGLVAAFNNGGYYELDANIDVSAEDINTYGRLAVNANTVLVNRNTGTTYSIKQAEEWPDNGGMIKISPNITLTLGESNQAGTIIFDGNNVDTSYGIYGSGATLLMNDGITIQNFKDSAVMISGSNGYFVMYGGSIINNYSKEAGAVDILEGSFDMHGGLIADNESEKSGAGVCFIGDTFNMYGGQIARNTAESFGGGAIVIGNFNMSDGIIGGETESDANRAALGGGVALSSNYDVGTFNMTGGTIGYNVAERNGGGVYFIPGDVAEEYSENVNTFNMSGGTIIGNKALGDNAESFVTPEGGGGIYMGSGKFVMSGTAQIKGNSANYGGGILTTFEDSGELIVEINDGTITENTATVGGGGIANMVYETTVKVNGGKITKNTAVYGGGIYNTSTSGQFISQVVLKTMFYDDGSYYDTLDDFIEDSEIYENFEREFRTVDEFYGYIGYEKTESISVFFKKYFAKLNEVNGEDAYIMEHYDTREGFLTVGNAELSENTATYGGGIYVNNTAYFDNGLQIIENTATYGGGIYFEDSTSIMPISKIGNVEINGNTATGKGNGIFTTVPFELNNGANITSTDAICLSETSIVETGSNFATDNQISLELVEYNDNVVGRHVVHTNYQNGDANSIFDKFIMVENDKRFTLVINNAESTYIDATKETSVTFVYYGGEGMGVNGARIEVDVPYGGTSEAPVLDENHRPGYKFIGWNPDPATTIVTDEIEITAIYEAREDTAYTVEYYMQYIEEPSYVFPATPTNTETLYGITDTEAAVEAKVIKGYNFDADNPANISSGIIKGNGSLTLKLYYNLDTNNNNIDDEIDSFNVTFTDWNDSIVETQSVLSGSAAIAPAQPDTFEGYVFEKWDKDFSVIRNDLTVKAMYKLSSGDAEVYNVYFVNWDGTILKTEEVAKGADATPPADPDDIQYYSFIGWNKNYTNIQNETVVSAKFQKTSDPEIIMEAEVETVVNTVTKDPVITENTVTQNYEEEVTYNVEKDGSTKHSEKTNTVYEKAQEKTVNEEVVKEITNDETIIERTIDNGTKKEEYVVVNETAGIGSGADKADASTFSGTDGKSNKELLVWLAVGLGVAIITILLLVLLLVDKRNRQKMQKTLSILITVTLLATVAYPMFAFAGDETTITNFTDLKNAIETGSTTNIIIGNDIVMEDVITVRRSGITILPAENTDVTLLRGTGNQGNFFRVEMPDVFSNVVFNLGESDMNGTLTLDGNGETVHANASLVYGFSTSIGGYNEQNEYINTYYSTTLNIYDGVTLKNNFIETISNGNDVSGGAIWLGARSTFNMFGGSIANNTVKNTNGNYSTQVYGGGVYISESANVNITGGEIINNSAISINPERETFSSNNQRIQAYGGGMYIAQNSNITLRNIKVSGNTASAVSHVPNGATYYQEWNGSYTTFNEEINACGGGIYAQCKAINGDITGLIVENNTAIASGLISENYVSAEGGGIVISYYKALSFNRQVTENDIEENKTEVNFKDSVISNNMVSATGGKSVEACSGGLDFDVDVYCYSSYMDGSGTWHYQNENLETKFKMDGTVISGNKVIAVQNDLGAEVTAAGDDEDEECLDIYIYGGGMVLSGNADVVINNSDFKNNTLDVTSNINDISSYSEMYTLVEGAGLFAEQYGHEPRQMTIGGGSTFTGNKILLVENGNDKILLPGGGGICSYGYTINLDSCSINNNGGEGCSYGGGIAFAFDIEGIGEEEPVNAKINSGAEITNNSATYGGGIALCGGIEAVLNGGNISNNTALYGGGIYSVDIEDLLLKTLRSYAGVEADSLEEATYDALEIELEMEIVRNPEGLVEQLFNAGVFSSEDTIEEMLSPKDDWVPGQTDDGIYITEDGVTKFLNRYTEEYSNFENTLINATTYQEFWNILKKVDKLNIKSYDDVISLAFRMIFEFDLSKADKSMAKFVINSGTISGNKVLAGGQGEGIYNLGALRINANGQVNSNNDVYLAKSTLLVLNEAPVNSFVARVTPSEYITGKQVVFADYSNFDMSVLKDKFSVTDAGIVVDTENAGYLMVMMSFDVTFVDWDGTEIAVIEDVTPGESIEAPTTGFGRTGYTFTGWDKDLENIVGETTITATYTPNTNTPYTVEYYFQTSNGEYPETPVTETKTGTTDSVVEIGGIIKGYVFDENAENILSGIIAGDGSLVLKAYYKLDANNNDIVDEKEIFTVTFVDWDGTVLKEESVQSGKSATAPEAPDTLSGYTFAGWNTSFANVTSDLTVTARYSPNTVEENTFRVYFLDWDGSILKIEVVENGGSATAPEAPNTMEHYAYKGWSGDFSNVTSTLIIVAQYEVSAEPKVVKYTVTNTITEIIQPEIQKENTEITKTVKEKTFTTVTNNIITTITEKVISPVKEKVITTIREKVRIPVREIITEKSVIEKAEPASNTAEVGNASQSSSEISFGEDNNLKTIFIAVASGLGFLLLFAIVVIILLITKRKKDMTA